MAALMSVLAACGGGSSGGHSPGSHNAGGQASRANQATGATPPPPGASAGLHQGQLSSGGQARSYLIYTPPGLAPSRRLPLVLVLGGVGDTPEDMVGATQFDPLASTDGLLVAYPQGLYGSSWNAGFCCAAAFVHQVDDIGFLVALVHHLEAAYPVDPGRVYVSGVSAGAMMAYRMACEQAGLVSGLGSVAGAMVLASCHPSRPVPVIEIHGTADPLVPFRGGTIQPPGAMASAPAPSSQTLVADWASLDGCPQPPAVHTSGHVTTSTWAGCRDGTAVTLVAVTGGGHTWFANGFGPFDGALDASARMWSFFAGLPPAPPAPGA